jgi:hypothetical protein
MDYSSSHPYPARILANPCLRHPNCTLFSIIPANKRMPCYALHSTEPDTEPDKLNGGYTVAIVQALIRSTVPRRG